MSTIEWLKQYFEVISLIGGIVMFFGVGIALSSISERISMMYKKVDFVYEDMHAINRKCQNIYYEIRSQRTTQKEEVPQIDTTSVIIDELTTITTKIDAANKELKRIRKACEDEGN